MPRTRERQDPGDGFALTQIQDRPTRSRQVFDELRLAIVRGDLPPNALYSVTELAAQFGVSRTPVREALIELASLGMVRFERNRGLRILESTARDLEEIFELRIMLEVPATGMAAEKAQQGDIDQLRAILDRMSDAADRRSESDFRAEDRHFHRNVLMLAGNSRLVDYVETLRDLVLVRGATTSGRDESLGELFAAHEHIFDAIRRADPAEAVRAMESHLRRTQRKLLARQRMNHG